MVRCDACPWTVILNRDTHSDRGLSNARTTLAGNSSGQASVTRSRVRLVLAVAVGPVLTAVASVLFQVITDGHVSSWATVLIVAAVVTMATGYSARISISTLWRGDA